MVDIRKGEAGRSMNELGVAITNVHFMRTSERQLMNRIGEVYEKIISSAAELGPDCIVPAKTVIHPRAEWANRVRFYVLYSKDEKHNSRHLASYRGGHRVRRVALGLVAHARDGAHRSDSSLALPVLLQ